MAPKDYTDWHEQKTLLHHGTRQLYFYEQEVWWTTLGCNIGYEEDGKNDDYSRPVLILRKFHKHLFLGVPLSSRPKEGDYYHTFSYKEGVESVALLSQLRALSPSRLIRKDGTVSQSDYQAIQKKIGVIIGRERQK